MKSLLTCVLACCITMVAESQSFTLRGKVTDQQSGQALTGASVVCQHTTIGTTTNAEGLFSLNLPEGGYDLAVTFSGYETFTLRISAQTASGAPLEINLRQKEKQMEEVAITVSNEVKDGWTKYGGFFQEQFIGKTPNSVRCVIENPETLRFFYNKKKNRLKVTAREELRIRNEALGYMVRYQLDSFVHEYASGATLSTGFPLFEEMTGNDEQKATWAVNREKAYYGSMLHFMRCYYDSTLGENSYRLERVDSKSGKTRLLGNPYDSTLYSRDEMGNVDLSLNGQIRIVYAQEKPEPSYLEQQKLSAATTIQISVVDFPALLTIEENGYFFDQKEILAFGYWGWEKAGDFLPYNYEPSGN